MAQRAPSLAHSAPGFRRIRTAPVAEVCLKPDVERVALLLLVCILWGVLLYEVLGQFQ